MQFRQSTSIFLLLLSIGFASTARASVLAFEPFDYSPGSFNGANGGFGFKTAWSTGPDLSIQPGNLSVAGYSSVGNEVHLLSNTTNGATRTLTSNIGAIGTDLWLSYMTEVESSGAYSSLAIGGLHFGILGNTTGGGPPSSTWGMDLQGGIGQVFSQVPVVYGQTVRLVAHVQFLPGPDRIDLYVNPTTITPPAVSDATKTDVDLISQPLSLVTLVANISDVLYDDVRFGTTYADVAPVPEPPGLALGIIACIALYQTRRRFV